jgi:amino-acid N-acetyltransferase
MAFPIAIVLKEWERDALAAALSGAHLPTDDVREPGRMFWRFETTEGGPLGFGGLEVHGRDALLRSVVTLPMLRKRGNGATIVAALELEAKIRGASTVWLLTNSAKSFFERLGYATCDRAVVPDAIRATREFATLCPASADVMVKRFLG